MVYGETLCRVCTSISPKNIDSTWNQIRPALCLSPLMAASKLIVVVGATGTQGGSVARTFLKEPGWRVRGITSSSASRRLEAKGMEMVSANLDQTQSLISSFEGRTLSLE